MCGILGILNRSGVSSADISRMLPLLHHRGPDGQGSIVDGPVALGHTRLSIIDLSEQSAQPMRTRDGRFIISYNGEVYNYIELREELRARGANFATASDTEVVLEAYRQWGADCVHHFRGMFAFALWDSHAKTLFLARDRCGERPLFYHHSVENFFFASELKALLPLLPQKPDLNPAAVDMYLHYQYTPEPLTLLQGVRKLPAGHSLTLSTENWHAEPVRYWDVETCADNWAGPVPTDTPGLLRVLRETLEEAVILTLRADVPVALALSGGIDSGAIAALAQKHYSEPMHAFSVGYPGRPPYDEREQARQLAKSLGLIFHEVILPVDDFVNFFPSLVQIMDEPIADAAAFGHFAVPRAARDMGIKVLLTGIGGDELFWGYDWVRQAAVHNARRLRGEDDFFLNRLLLLPGMRRLVHRTAQSGKVPAHIRALLARWIENMPITPENGQSALAFSETVPDFAFARGNLRNFYGKAMCDVAHANAYTPECIGKRLHEAVPAAVVRLLFDTWLVSNCLTLGDRVSMGSSVEARLPFLDFRLIECVMALRAQHPDHLLGQKQWLRAALKGVLPDEVLARPKAGFNPPVRAWLSGVIKKYGPALQESILVTRGYIREERVRAAISNPDNASQNEIFMTYKLVLLDTWLRKLVDRDGCA